jgi:hypothetical protein
VNEARDAHGAPAVNGVWFSDGGRLADVGALPVVAVVAPPGRLGDVARGVAIRGGGRADALHNDDGLAAARARIAPGDRAAPATMLFVLQPAPDDLRRLDARWLAPALDLLAASSIERLHVVSDGDGAAAAWSASAPGWGRRLAVRFGRHRFGLPQEPAR